MFVFFKKQKIIDYKKACWPKLCNIIFLFFLKIVLVGRLDQQNSVSPHVGKRPDWKNKVNFKICDVTTWLTNNCNTHIDQSLKM